MTERVRCTESSCVWRLRLVGLEMPEIYGALRFGGRFFVLPHVQPVEIHAIVGSVF